MKEYDLTLILNLSHEEYGEPDDIAAIAERSYPQFNDGTVGVSCGVPYIALTREAESLEAAVKSALASAKAVGVGVKQINLDPADFS